MKFTDISTVGKQTEPLYRRTDADGVTSVSTMVITDFDRASQINHGYNLIYSYDVDGVYIGSCTDTSNPDSIIACTFEGRVLPRLLAQLPCGEQARFDEQYEAVQWLIDLHHLHQRRNETS